ncbi:putative DNA primase/helicase [Flavobacteriaceae bacterium MAR_2009_75]|nr:putative DNA primase/helicase [Flavobacteriaceae bacterium MAR_2009_75]
MNEPITDLLHETEELPQHEADSITITPDRVLNELLKNISLIDFLLLAYPESKEIITEIEVLKPLVIKPDGSINQDNKEDLKEFEKLQKRLQSFKISRNHFLIITVEQLLKIAKAKQWGLCKRNGFIYVYNGNFWNEINKEQFQHFLGKAALKMGVEKFKAKIHSFKDELFKQFMCEAYLPTPPENPDQVLINLVNGTFEIDTNGQRLRSCNQEDFITHQLPFKYDPDAKAPLFHKYLDEVLPEKDKQKVLAEYAGYIFTRPKVLKLEKMLILYGNGANGKSVFFEIINALLGRSNISNYSLQSLTDDKGYHRAKIANKLVNYASEINGKLEVDTFKQIASGEPIEARLPYGEPFIIEDYAKLIFNCNDLPRDVEHTNAFFRRFLIIHFNVTIPEHKQDKGISKKIIDNELSGVFNWILEGLNRLLKQKNFTKCAAIENARSDYERQSDSVKQYIDEYNYIPSPTNTIKISEIYQRYRNYCAEDGLRPVSKSNFMKRLNHHGIFTKRMSLGNVAMANQENQGNEF